MIGRLRRHGASLSPRTKRLLSTAAASYLARFGAVVTLLLTIPLARSTMTPDRFGLWMMLGSLLGFFAFADLGTGNGVLKRFSDAIHRDNHGEAGRVMLAGYACAVGSGLLLCIAWGLWIALAADPLIFAGTVAAGDRVEAQRGFTAFVLLFAVNLPLQLAQKFQLARQDGHWVGLTQLACSMASLIALPLALSNQASLPQLLLCTLGLQAAIQGLSSVVWLAHRGWIQQLTTVKFDFNTVASLYKTGMLFFVLQLSAGFAFQSDAFVITQLLGPAAYGDFAAIQRVFLSMSTLVGAALLGLWPAFGEAISRGDLAWARKTYLRSLWTGLLVMGSLCLLVTLSMPLIARHWLGMHTPPTLWLPVVLSVWTVLDTLGQITGSLLNGAGILRAQVLFAIVMAGSAFAAKWLLVPELGALGATSATILAYCVVSIPAQVWLLARLLNKPLGTPSLHSAKIPQV